MKTKLIKTFLGTFGVYQENELQDIKNVLAKAKEISGLENVCGHNLLDRDLRTNKEVYLYENENGFIPLGDKFILNGKEKTHCYSLGAYKRNVKVIFRKNKTIDIVEDYKLSTIEYNGKLFKVKLPSYMM